MINWRLIMTCKTCNNEILNRTSRATYCLICASSRRKEKMTLYSKNRDQEKVLARRSSGNLKRRLLRYSRIELNLCMECGRSRERSDISKCNYCHGLASVRSLTYCRKHGMLPAGNSKPEQMTYDVLKSITDLEIIRNTRKYIKSPISNSSLELDIFIPDLMFAIEVDGPMHRMPCYGQKRLDAQILNDSIKDQQCAALGIYLLRINTDDITSENFIRTILSQAIGIVIAIRNSTIEGATHSG